jgi:hypothetical protein
VLVWAALVRMLTLFVAAELSGGAHLATDVYEALAGLEHHDQADCGDQGADHECPPGCPSCHCTHTSHGALVFAVPAYAPHLRLWLPPRAASSFALASDRKPGLAQRDSLYRPPRRHA